MTQTYANVPVHIRIAAEQTKEVEDCIAALKTTPVAWLLDNANVDPRWCLIHATHMTAEETRGLAKSGAVAGLCPLTKLRSATASSMRRITSRRAADFGVGTDSNTSRSAAADELRMPRNIRSGSGIARAT